LKTKEKTTIKSQLKNGEIDIIVGTHAIIQEDVDFQKLSYVIIDEQHRFGVEQRERLTEYTSQLKQEKELQEIQNTKYKIQSEGMDDFENSVNLSSIVSLVNQTNTVRIMPHVLMMTATPIPRTLSMALYGNQDISIIREYPAERKKVLTKIITEHHINEAYRWIDTQIDMGFQVYWISPLVNESDKIDAISVHETAEKLRMIFPQRSIGILHGKMKPEEKDAIMQDFLDKKYDILSSTSVIEVGIDNPRATVVCIEDAHRFGLSQLHQFRGRV